MTPEEIYDELEEILSRIGVALRMDEMDEEFSSMGGLCKANGALLLILDRRLTTPQKNAIIAQSLRRLNLEAIYIKPYIREAIETGMCL